MSQNKQRGPFISILLAVGVIIIVAVVGLTLRSKIVEAPGKTSHSKTSAGKTAPPAAPSFNKKQYSIDDPPSIWVVVNKLRPLNPVDYAPSDLTPVGNGQYMRAEAAQALVKMIAAAQAAGITLTPDSGYRSYQTQVSVYNNEVKSYGQAVADSESAKPGYSEHQTGWAMDLGSGGCNIDDCFANTPGGQWVAAHAYQYGFIVRYQQDKENVTGYRYEPWHVRYIGTELSNEMHKEGITTLEEFFDLPNAG